MNKAIVIIFIILLFLTASNGVIKEYFHDSPITHAHIQSLELRNSPKQKSVTFANPLTTIPNTAKTKGNNVPSITPKTVIRTSNTNSFNNISKCLQKKLSNSIHGFPNKTYNINYTWLAPVVKKPYTSTNKLEELINRKADSYKNNYDLKLVKGKWIEILRHLKEFLTKNMSNEEYKLLLKELNRFLLFLDSDKAPSTCFFYDFNKSLSILDIRDKDDKYNHLKNTFDCIKNAIIISNKTYLDFNQDLDTTIFNLQKTKGFFIL